MPSDGSGALFLVALFGGGAALMMGGGQSSAPSPGTSLPVPTRGPGGPVWRVYGYIGQAYPRVIPPQDIMLVFREFRTEQQGPIGSTRIWTSQEQLHFDNSLEDVHAQMGKTVIVHIRPQWLGGEDVYVLDNTDEVVPVWIRPEAVAKVIPSRIIDHALKAQLAELEFVNGERLDITQTLKQARAAFPKAEHPKTRSG